MTTRLGVYSTTSSQANTLSTHDQTPTKNTLNLTLTRQPNEWRKINIIIELTKYAWETLVFTITTRCPYSDEKQGEIEHQNLFHNHNYSKEGITITLNEKDLESWHRGRYTIQLIYQNTPKNSSEVSGRVADLLDLRWPKNSRFISHLL